VPQIQGVKGEAVPIHRDCELLTTLEMGFHPTRSGKGKRNEDPKEELYSSLIEEIIHSK
jgi:hypothetical protein